MLNRLIDKYVTPVMSAQGFRKTQLVWNRDKLDFVHMLDIQKSRWNDKTNTQFTINIGVCLRRVWQIYWDQLPPRVVRECDCFPCIRVGYLIANSSTPKDIWWSLTSPADIDLIGAELQNILSNKCIPFLNKLNSIHVIKALAEDPAFRKFPADMLYYAILKHLAGERVEAVKLLKTML